MGYAPYFWSALTYKDIWDKDDDQLFYTQLYLSPARVCKFFPVIRYQISFKLFFNLL